MREHEDEPFTAEDIRFTVRGNNLYAICLGWPGEKAQIKTLRRGATISENQIEQIDMLGSSERLSWSQDDDSLQISTPTEKPGDHAYVFRITLKDV